MRKSQWDYHYFNWNEFDSPDKKDSGLKMKKDFMDLLETARTYSGISYKINSGYRTKDRNKTIGAKSTSSHLKGLACDVSAIGSQQRYKILKGLLSVGFNRIGINKNFIHVDNDKSKSKNVAWIY